MRILYRDAVNEFHYNIEYSVLSERIASSHYKFFRRRLNRNTPIPTMIDSQGRPVNEDATKTELFNDFSIYLFI